MQVLASLYRDERGLRFLAGQFYCQCLTTNAAEPLALQPTESAYVSSKPWRVMGRASWWGEGMRRRGGGAMQRSIASLFASLPSIFLSFFMVLTLSLSLYGLMALVDMRARTYFPLFFFSSSNEIEGSSFVSTRESASYIPRG